MMQGNEACAEAAIAAGCRFFAGYPITPATEIAEIMAARLPQVGGTFIQMEDELGSMAAVVGASIGGLKAMTATSGPGFTLKQENIGFAIMAEVPCVVVDVQRGGPSTGLPTLPAQGDILQARWGTHGDHPAIALCPASVRETYDLTIQAFNLAERLRTPVVILTDAVVGHIREKVILPDPSEIVIVERKRPKVGPKEYKPYEPEEDLVPPMVSFGEGYRYNITSNIHDRTGFPATTNHKVAIELVARLQMKVEKHRHLFPAAEQFMLDDADVAVVAFGSVARSARRAVLQAREKGIKAGLLRLVTIWPFPDAAVLEAAERARCLIVAEMNLGQVAGEVARAARNAPADIISLAQVGGLLIAPGQILQKIEEAVQSAKGARMAV